MKQHVWLVVFNSNTCRIYEYHRQAISLVKALKHPENRLKDIELTSDKPGRYKSMGGFQGVYTQESDPKEIKIDNFAREIAQTLEAGRVSQAYETLMLVAPPRMIGLVNKHNNKHVKLQITHDLEKDLLHLTEADLLNTIKESIEV